ncbi:ribosome-binding factor A, partial [Bacteroides coprosuis]
METTRQQKISRLIQKELSEIFLQQTKATNGILISVSEVRVTSDLSIARAYLSIFPNDKKEELIENI